MIPSRRQDQTEAQQSQPPQQSPDNCQPDEEPSATEPEPSKASTAAPAAPSAPVPVAAAAAAASAGALTMPDFMAYIEIMRRLLGNEFVCEADIVAIPKEGDRFWINEHIRAHRPVARLDKEFVAPFGLMLPDVTQLPATFDVLLANLQAKDMNTDMNVDICTGSSSGYSSGSGSVSSSSSSCGGVARLGDTYAIEIKPKQGWLQLPSDVSDLFDLMPAAGDQTIDPSLTCDRGKSRGKCRCRYCSMQQLKLQSGKIKRLSDYCPLELFSGAPSRMLAALNALFACPQNNLRIFQNGNLIYGDHANSISCDELHTRLFPGEIMALIKHLLVACLLREYHSAGAEGQQLESEPEPEPESNVAAFGESAGKRHGSETKATATTEIGAANAAPAPAAPGREARASGIVECVKAVAAGQPQRRSTRAAGVEKATQRYTKRSRKATTTTAETRPTTTSAPLASVSTHVVTAAGEGGGVEAAAEETGAAAEEAAEAAGGEAAAGGGKPTAGGAVAAAEGPGLARGAAAEGVAPKKGEAAAEGAEERTEGTAAAAAARGTAATTTRTETETLAVSDASQAEISRAQIFHLPKNCVLQKILHLQLLVKRHFHYMWQAGHAEHATPSYGALRALLSCHRPADNADQLAPEQAYMLGATALDCSIMLTFQEIRCQPRHNSALQPWLVTLQGRKFLTKLSVLDLDPKPDSHFHKFIKQTREIEKCCRALN
ncbi:hypothetical protein KR222_004917 [Zaprionus bogoriensis]|nr:hypothetical protein KR222_004917 [Zaprionus bogoriensis]